MKIETGWLNDDFVRNLITIRIDDPEKQLMVTFKAEVSKPNMTNAICNRLILFKATRIYNKLLSMGTTGRIYWSKTL